MSTTQIKDGFQGGTDNQLLVNLDGSINVKDTGGSTTNPSVGLNGAIAPTMSTEVSGINPSGKLTPLNVDAGGALITTAEMSMVEGFSTVVAGYPALVSVGTNSTQLLPANPLRAYAHVINNTSFKVFVQIEAVAQLNMGFPVRSGTVLFISGNDLYRGNINAISPVANTLIEVLEGEA